MIDITIRQQRGVPFLSYQFRKQGDRNSPLGVFLVQELDSLRRRVEDFITQGAVTHETENLIETVQNPAVHETLEELRDLLVQSKQSGKPLDLEKVTALRQKLLNEGIKTTPRENVHFEKKKPVSKPDESFSVEGIKVTGGKFDDGVKEKSDAEIEQAVEQSRWKRKQEALAQLTQVSPEEIIKAGKKKPSRKKPAVGDPYQ